MGVPPFSHIVVVVEENKNYDEIIGNTTQAPYINSLVAGDTTARIQSRGKHRSAQALV